MNRLVLKSRISSDGVLNLSVPVGLEEANQEVQVTVERAAVGQEMSQDVWRAWVESMAGSWQGDFTRPPQGQMEDREPLS